MTEVIFDVCWSGPVAPTIVQGAGDQEAEALVRGLEETFPLDATKVAALSVSSPSMVRLVASEPTLSALN